MEDFVMPYLLLGCQLVLTIILLTAVVSKLLYTQQLVIALRVSAIPQFLGLPTAILVILFEAELVLSLILSIQGMLPFAFAGTFAVLNALADPILLSLQVVGLFGTLISLAGVSAVIWFAVFAFAVIAVGVSNRTR